MDGVALLLLASFPLDPSLDTLFDFDPRSILLPDRSTQQCDWARPGDAHPGCMMYDNACRRLLTATNRPYVWHHKARCLVFRAS